MQIKCSKCGKLIVIADDKLPKDKEKAMVKCPACTQALVFIIPAAIRQPVMTGAGVASSPKTGPESQQPIGGGGEKTVIEWSRPSPSKPRLVNETDGTTLELKPGENIFGRSGGPEGAAPQSSNPRFFHVITGDKYISHKHCLINVIEQHGNHLCTISDDGSISDSGLPSTNGTFCNDKKLTKFDKLFLSPGDKVRIGHTEFIFKTE